MLKRVKCQTSLRINLPQDKIEKACAKVDENVQFHYKVLDDYTDQISKHCKYFHRGKTNIMKNNCVHTNVEVFLKVQH